METWNSKSPKDKWLIKSQNVSFLRKSEFSLGMALSYGKARWSSKWEKDAKGDLGSIACPGRKHLLFLQVYKGISLHFMPGSQELR